MTITCAQMHHGATSGNKGACSVLGSLRLLCLGAGVPVDRTYVGSMPYLLAPLPGTQAYVVGVSNHQQIIYTPSVIASPLCTCIVLCVFG